MIEIHQSPEFPTRDEVIAWAERTQGNARLVRLVAVYAATNRAWRASLAVGCWDVFECPECGKGDLPWMP